MPTDVPPTLMFVPKLRALLEEAMQLNNDDVTRKGVVLRAALSSTVSTGSDSWSPPRTHKALIVGVRHHLVITDPASETEPMTGMASQSFRDRERFKASNCRVQMQNQETQQVVLGDNRQMALSSLIDEPLNWNEMPYFLAPGQKVNADFTLVTTGTNVYVGGATEYGLLLDVILVRVKADGA